MKSGCDASVYWYGVPSLNHNREMLQEIVSWTRFPCLQPDPSTQIPYQGHRLEAQHSHGLDCKWRKKMAKWKATIFILFSLLCCGCHSPWCWDSISSIGWCEGVWASRVPYQQTTWFPRYQGHTIWSPAIWPDQAASVETGSWLMTEPASRCHSVRCDVDVFLHFNYSWAVLALVWSTYWGP